MIKLRKLLRVKGFRVGYFIMSRQAIFEASVQYFLEPIVPLLQDESVSEIMVNGHNDIYVERAGKLVHTDLKFQSEDALLSAIHNVTMGGPGDYRGASGARCPIARRFPRSCRNTA